MDSNQLSDELDRTLEQYARAGVSTAASDQLGTVYFDLRLSPKAHQLLEDYADAHGCERYEVIAFVIQWYGGPLRDTVPVAFRVSLPAFPLIERQPLSREEADRLAQALLARFRRRESPGSRAKFARHNFRFSLAMKQMLDRLAAYHGLYVNRMLETLISLVLLDPVVKPDETKSPAHRRKQRAVRGSA